VAIKKPVGVITRGTTNPNRLRRVDRFIASQPILKMVDRPIVVDLGFGASPITAIELLERLSKVNSRTEVVGIEIDRDRVERGLEVARDKLHFTHGGFEVPLPPQFNEGATVIRAFNVLRQYDESEVDAAWAQMQSRLAPGGLLIEGTCDEIGRLSCWVTLDATGPKTLTLSYRLTGLELPSKIAERLPKKLIHRNVEGEGINRFLSALDRAWHSNAGLGAFSPAQRWVATCQMMQDQEWPLLGLKKRWRLGELTLDWQAVAPNQP
jgi:hypothetical protein